jgi:hypothetical protein
MSRLGTRRRMRRPAGAPDRRGADWLVAAACIHIACSESTRADKVTVTTGYRRRGSRQTKGEHAGPATFKVILQSQVVLQAFLGPTTRISHF